MTYPHAPYMEARRLRRTRVRCCVRSPISRVLAAFVLMGAVVSAVDARIVDRGYWPINGWVYHYTYDTSMRLHTYRPVVGWDYSDPPGELQHPPPEPKVLKEPVPGTFGRTYRPGRRVPLAGGGLTVVVVPSQGSHESSYLDMSVRALSSVGVSLGLSRNDCAVEVHIYTSREQFELGLSQASTLRSDTEGYTVSHPPGRYPFIVCVDGAESMGATERTLQHEITHVLLEASAGEHAASIPAWFNEGVTRSMGDEISKCTMFATYLTVLGAEPPDVAALEFLHEHVLHGSEVDAAKATAYSADLVAFCKRRYGHCWIAGVCESLKDGCTFDDAFRHATGVALDDAVAEWHRDLHRRARRALIIAPVVCLGVLVAPVVCIVLAVKLLRRRRARSTPPVHSGPHDADGGGGVAGIG